MLTATSQLKYNMDPKKKFFLFKKSKYFCSVPWNYFKVDPDGTIYTCVPGRIELGDATKTPIQTILQNPVLKEIREYIYNDKLHPNCIDCHGYANDDYQYLRALYNDYFRDQDVDYSDPTAFVMSGADIHWSSTCTLKCVTCWEYQSSSIAQEKRIPIVTTSESEMAGMTDFIVANQHTLKELYFTGGEPTLIKHNLRLLKRLDKNTNTLLRLNTNMMFREDNQIIEEFLKFPNIMFTISADAMGNRFNYIRQGANWDYFRANLERLKKTHLKWRVSSVFSVASAITLADTQQFFRDQYDIQDFTVNQCLMEKYALECRNLPETVKQQVRHKLIEYMQRHHSDLNVQGQMTNCLKEMDAEPNGTSFADFFGDIDRKRGTDWRSALPELVGHE